MANLIKTQNRHFFSSDMEDPWAQIPGAVQLAPAISSRRSTLFDDAAHELMHRVGMRAAMPAAVHNGRVFSAPIDFDRAGE
jgi:hypothetical protein